MAAQMLVLLYSLFVLGLILPFGLPYFVQVPPENLPDFGLLPVSRSSFVRGWCRAGLYFVAVGSAGGLAILASFETPFKEYPKTKVTLSVMIVIAFLGEASIDSLFYVPPFVQSAVFYATVAFIGIRRLRNVHASITDWWPLRVVMGLMYVFTGLSKLNPAFADGEFVDFGQFWFGHVATQVHREMPLIGYGAAGSEALAGLLLIVGGKTTSLLGGSFVIVLHLCLLPYLASNPLGVSFRVTHCTWNVLNILTVAAIIMFEAQRRDSEINMCGLGEVLCALLIVVFVVWPASNWLFFRNGSYDMGFAMFSGQLPGIAVLVDVSSSVPEHLQRFVADQCFDIDAWMRAVSRTGVEDRLSKSGISNYHSALNFLAVTEKLAAAGMHGQWVGPAGLFQRAHTKYWNCSVENGCTKVTTTDMSSGVVSSLDACL